MYHFHGIIGILPNVKFPDDRISVKLFVTLYGFIFPFILSTYISKHVVTKDLMFNLQSSNELRKYFSLFKQSQFKRETFSHDFFLLQYTRF